MSSQKRFRFFLKSGSNPDKESAIFLIKSISGKSFKYGIGKSILPLLWDKEEQRPKEKKAAIIEHQRCFGKKPYHHLAADLENISNRINKVISYIKRFEGNHELQQRALNFEELRAYLDINVKKVIKGRKPTEIKKDLVSDYFIRFVKEIDNGSVLIRGGKRKGLRYSSGTVKSYKGTSVQFLAFEKETRERYRWESIDFKFYDKFVQFFNSKGYHKNTIGRHIKNLKVLMDHARAEGLHNNLLYKEKHFETLKASTTEVYLDNNELELIRNYDLSERKPFEKIRDVFLIGCYTALRFSDVKRIEPQHVKKGTLSIITQKTGEKVVIPIRPELDFILKKYNYKVPKIYEQKLNKGIKVICKELGINEPIEKRQQIGGLEKITTTPKYELIKSHTGRRTGATLLYLAGVSTFDIMKITGHKTESNLLKYIRVSPEEVAERLKDNSFFLGNTLKIAK